MMATRTLASLIVALSGLVLFADKVLFFEFDNLYGFKNPQTLIWVISQTISPLILVLGAVFRPYKVAYTIPVYFYSVQLFWVFEPDIPFDDLLLQIYAIGCVVGFIMLILSLNLIYARLVKRKKVKSSFWEETLDFSIGLHGED